MPQRKSMGKRLRFEIFKRDSFTCQYCGTQPPVAVLVIDHVRPVAEGGGNDPTNLITACEACNQGKSDKPLNNVSPRPDADLEWLAMQQELAELRRYQLAKMERDEILDEIADDLTATFERISGFYWKTASVKSGIEKMLTGNSPEDVETAILAAAKRVSGGFIDRPQWERYAWGVLKHIREDQA